MREFLVIGVLLLICNSFVRAEIADAPQMEDHM